MQIKTKCGRKSVQASKFNLTTVAGGSSVKSHHSLFGNHKRGKGLKNTKLWMNYVIVYGHGWVKELILGVKHFSVVGKGNMAMEGASITWLVLIALSLTSCHFSNVNGKLLNSD